ncbi:hypothetical protein [Microcoleus sp. PH2017_18_LLB_O_A]|nr:hypothetical protein [Microcoleus sp. PH2017_18_LLB_O_A]MCC3520004.1 hypothetical protein [Microcoleus sp. PH2017_18_LLB_O_A]
MAALTLGLSFINLDRAETKNILKSNPAISVLTELEQNYEPWLNLYAQCRIYWELNQVANFLSRLTSFYEELLNYLIIALGGSKYFFGDFYDLKLQKSLFETELWDIFYPYASKDSKFKKYDFENKSYWLKDRWGKSRLVTALVEFHGKDSADWEYIKESLLMLEYWVNKRNKMIHLAKGISKTTMWEMLKLDRESENKEVKNAAIQACDPDEILQIMSVICSRTFELLGLDDKFCLGYDSTTPYYIYSDIIDWVLRHLETDKLR